MVEIVFFSGAEEPEPFGPDPRSFWLGWTEERKSTNTARRRRRQRRKNCRKWDCFILINTALDDHWLWNSPKKWLIKAYLDIKHFHQTRWETPSVRGENIFAGYPNPKSRLLVLSKTLLETLSFSTLPRARDTYPRPFPISFVFFLMMMEKALIDEWKVRHPIQTYGIKSTFSTQGSIY